MSNASNQLILSLRSSISRAVADQVERDMIATFEDLGYASTFESPIETMMFHALALNVVQRGRVVGSEIFVDAVGCAGEGFYYLDEVMFR